MLVAKLEKPSAISVDCVLAFSFDLMPSQSTIACALEQHLVHLKKFAYRLDGDNIRFGLNKDLGFSEADRNENIRRIGEVKSTLPIF